MIDIDMVFTYVNGNDSKFIKKINIYQKKYNIKKEEIIKRYNDINEINYAIKSVIKYIPFIRKIFVVTDNQQLNIDISLYKIKPIIIIDHKEIIDNKYLPTFYSDVIESYIHNIPDLSEIFLYNNDDCFHFSNILLDDILLYENEIIKLKVINDMKDSIIYNKFGLKFMNEYVKRIVHTRNIMKDLFNDDIYYVKNHVTKILRKSTLKYVENNYSYLLDKLRINKFRNDYTINYIFFVMNIENILYKDNIVINVKNNDKLYYFINNFERNTDNISNELNIIKPKFICINDIPLLLKEKFEELMEKNI